MAERKKKIKDPKEMTSIAYKLHWQLVRTKMGVFFATDIFLFIALSFLYLFKLESDIFGYIQNGINVKIFKYSRFFTTRGEGFLNFTYVVKDEEQVLLNERIFVPFMIICSLLLVSVIFHIINLILSYYGEYRRIKKTLKPINEMALKAEEISKMSFDDSKFHTIENAIEHISPEQTTELSLGDSDLQGIEAAMNNMLERIHDTYLQQARFVNDASHELRTPISVIQGYANMLDRWGKEDEEILDESITAIKNESDHMKHLVEQLLFLARGDAGRNTMNFEDVSLNEMMKEIYEESLMIDEKHVYRFQENAANVHIYADASMLKQAMRILVDNATKYTQEGDEIVLSLGIISIEGKIDRKIDRKQDGKLTDEQNDNNVASYNVPYIQVQDNGIGMAEVDVRHMFERFYRADDTRKVQGTGLGLSIAKWIVDKHRGEFEITSRKDIGTRIRIVFK